MKKDLSEAERLALAEVWTKAFFSENNDCPSCDKHVYADSITQSVYLRFFRDDSVSLQDEVAPLLAASSKIYEQINALQAEIDAGEAELARKDETMRQLLAAYNQCMGKANFVRFIHGASAYLKIPIAGDLSSSGKDADEILSMLKELDDRMRDLESQEDEDFPTFLQKKPGEK